MATTTPVTSPHVEAAKELLVKIRALRTEIPRFVLDDPAETQFLGRIAAVTEEFIEAACVALQRSARLETAAGANATALRDAYNYALAYEAVVTELHALTRCMTHTIRVQRAAARDVYVLAKRIANKKGGAELIPHVADMRKKLNSKRRKEPNKPADVAVKA
ncbi:MAG TPA: hypothetical protein VGF48_05310 [Thermoanaerobaculia bacterium]|jgi:hypothetical protein